MPIQVKEIFSENNEEKIQTIENYVVQNYDALCEQFKNIINKSHPKSSNINYLVKTIYLIHMVTLEDA